MDTFLEALNLLFGNDAELRQIVGVTLQMSLSSTTIAVVLGMPLGMLLGSRKFPGKRYVMRIVQTLMGLPPVVAGLLVFMLLSRQGPLGSFRLLFSVQAMIIAQVILILPIVAGLTASLISVRAPLIQETTRGLGLSRNKEGYLLLYESKRQLVSVAMTGFGRAIAEVGAVQLVGGNIQYKTRVMTTAIMLETNKGNFELAIALGMLLLFISLIVNSFAQMLQEEKND